MRKEYDIAVIIGRFQPIHKGHIPAFHKAAKIANDVVVVIGSSNAPSSPKNPFSAEERIDMINSALSTEKYYDISTIDKDGRLNIPSVPKYVCVEDTFYREQEWLRRVKSSVAEVADKIRILKLHSHSPILKRVEHELREELNIDPNDRYEVDTFLHLHGNQSDTARKLIAFRKMTDEVTTIKVAVLGHEKDESSYYLNNFSDWDFVDIGPWVGDSKQDNVISATDIRSLWLSNKLSFAKSNLHESTYKFMLDYPENDFLDLKEEYDEIEQYKAATQVGPFPVQFLTTDAVVVHGDEVLLVRRGLSPGKGLWALPGGFKQENETFFQSCIRELKEETSIKLAEKTLIKAVEDEKMFDYPKRSSRGTTVSMAYLFILDPTKPRPRVKAGDDAVMTWWFPLADLIKMRDQLFEDHYDIIDYMTSRI